MADPTPTPDPQPEKKPKQVHHDLSQADLATLTEAEQIGLNAQKTTYAPVILAEDPELDDTWVKAYLKLIDDTRTGQQTHKDDRAGVKTDTKAEDKIKTDLIAAINGVRGHAKTTYEKIAPEKLPLYSVGVNLYVSRKVLEGAADGILKELAKDTVLKINPAKLTELTTLAGQYKGANVTQGDDNVDAKNKQLDVKGSVANVVAGRRKIQAAINSGFVYTDPANAAHRQLFGLPANAPMH